LALAFVKDNDTMKLVSVVATCVIAYAILSGDNVARMHDEIARVTLVEVQ